MALLATACSAACTRDGGAPYGFVQRALRFERSNPAAGATEVAVDAAIDLYFSSPIAAETLRERSVGLSSGLVFSSVRLVVDLLERRLRALPDVVLRPNLDYRLTVGTDLRAIDGTQLIEPVTFTFTTGSRRGPRALPQPAGGLADLQPLWSTRCVDGCHSASVARAGLDLSSAAAALRDLRGVASDQSDLLRVAPGDHARSYLLRKLLVGAAIRGLPMPPTGPPLTDEELHAIAAWIDGGAQP